MVLLGSLSSTVIPSALLTLKVFFTSTLVKVVRLPACDWCTRTCLMKSTTYCKVRVRCYNSARYLLQMKPNWELWATTKHLISSWRFPLVSIYILVYLKQLLVYLGCLVSRRVMHLSKCVFLDFGEWLGKKNQRKCHMSLLEFACVAFLSLIFWRLHCISVSEKPWRDTSYTGLRARPHSATTTVIAPISMNSSGATGTGQSSLPIFTTLYSVFICLSKSTILCYFPSWHNVL